MAQQKYYPEEILVEKMQSGEYGWFVRFKDEQLEAAMKYGNA